MKLPKSPGIGLKLAYIGLLLFAPLIVTTVALIGEWRADIGITVDARDGLVYIAQLRKLIDPFTGHRGASTLSLAGTPGAAARSTQLELQVDEALVELRRIDALLGANFGTAAAVSEINTNWTVLREEWHRMSIADARSSHNVIAAQILALNEQVATAAKFAIDPHVDSHYLLDAVGLRLLPIANTTGWMRSQLAAAAIAGALTGPDRDRLVSNYERLRSGSDQVQFDMAKLSALHDPRTAAVPRLYEGYSRNARAFRELTGSILEETRITDLPDGIMTTGGLAKEAVFSLFDGALQAADRVIEERLQEEYKYVLLTSAITLALTVLAIIFAAKICSQLARQLGSARAAFARMEAGDFNSHLTAETRDEAGDVLAALARMQLSLKARIEKDAVLAAVAEYTDTAVSTTDPHGRILWLNAGFTRMTGLSAVEALGQLPEDLMNRKTTEPLVWSEAIKARESGQPWQGEARCLSREREYYALIESKPVYGADRSISGFILIETDITARRHAAEALREARDAADAASRAKSAFLANMSHEIRTPLNGVIGMTSLLLDGHLDQEQREFAEIARSSGESLLVLINDILDLSKIESGHLEFECLDFDLLSVVESCLDPVALAASKKDVEILLEVDPTVPRFVRGDPSRVRQIVLNLVSNAVKFTSQGDVRIQVSQAESAAGSRVRFEVRDNGIGMTAQQVAGLFVPFTQADASTTRRFGGTGLGLSITKRLIDAMKGDIRVESQLGQGSVFKVEIPLETARTLPQLPCKVELAGRHVFVIEDHPVNLRILQMQLSSAGLRVSVAASTGEALRVWNSLTSASDWPELILLDHDLPDHNGLWLADKFRSMSSLPIPPILLLTSLGGLVTAEAMANGCIRVLTKPLKRDALLEALASAVRAVSHSTAVAPRSPSDSALACLRVLAAEDNPVNQKLLKRLLDKWGIVVTLAETGLQAIERLKDASFDIVLMDCQMPELDGYEATQQIRSGMAGEVIRNVPIIALTAHALTGDRERCLLAGMSDYLTKPIEPAALREMLLKYSPSNLSQRTFVELRDASAVDHQIVRIDKTAVIAG